VIKTTGRSAVSDYVARAILAPVIRSGVGGSRMRVSHAVEGFLHVFPGTHTRKAFSLRTFI